jgi:chemotaxis protein methyltransferase WspC
LTACSKIEGLLRRTLGLDAGEISAMVAMHLNQRMARLGIDCSQDYWELLRGSPVELQEWIEILVVPETWFYRCPEAFEAMTSYVRDVWLQAHAQDVLRVLSIPCCSGEEPYSIAMSLLTAGVHPKRFHVDAIDVSLAALSRMAKGTYCQNSFRTSDLGFRDLFFERGPDGYRLAERVRRQVTAKRGNLLRPDFEPEQHRYDIIFCRNLLIYLEPSAQRDCLSNLERQLAPGGLLFVGSVELALSSAVGFTPAAKYPRAFACWKKPSSKLPRKHVQSRLKSTPELRPVETHLDPVLPSEASGGSLQNVSAVAGRGTVTLAEALEATRLLADLCRFDEAILSCERNLKEYGPSADLYCILGVVREATGLAKEAAHCYRKALYLEPDHQEALLHSALQAKKHGDDAAYRRLSKRARRAKESKAGDR